MGPLRVNTAFSDWCLVTLSLPIILCVRYFRRSALRLIKQNHTAYPISEVCRGIYAINRIKCSNYFFHDSPQTSDREIFADVTGKKRQGKKGKRDENWEEKKENCKREGGKLEMEVRKVIKRGEDPFFFQFWKWQKFVLSLPKWEFSIGKKHFTPRKKSGKMTLPPQKNMPVTPLRTRDLDS